MDSISVEAYAKINIGLDVLDKRDDGYHDVRMVMQTIDVCDTITLSKREDGNITVECDTDKIPVGEENLAYKAADEFKKEFNSEFSDEFDEWDFGVDIVIKKRIPVSAGLGGGSADAAAVLKAMNILFNTGLSRDRLMQIGSRVGSDVPYCIFGWTALAGGRGEKIKPLLGFPKTHLVIVKPLDLGISTAKAYGRLDEIENLYHPDIAALVDSLHEAAPLSEIAKHMGNTFEDVMVEEHPVIGEIKNTLEENGAVKAMMSGSGPSVYGLFKDEESAKKCADAVSSIYENAEVFLTKTR